MNFLAPVMFALAALLPVVLLLYFLKLKRRNQPVSSTWLWRKAVEDLRANSPFQKLRKNLLLYLQLLLLALMVFALARPAMNLSNRGGNRIICLIDTSASMAATDVSPSRIEAAKAEALRLIGAMSGHDEMMVMTFDIRPAVVQPFTRAKGQLRHAIESIHVRPTATDSAQALDLLRALVQTQTDVHLYLLSDGAFDQKPLEKAPNMAFHYVKIGLLGSNAAITAIEGRRSMEAWDQPELFVRVHNFSDAPRPCRVEIFVNNASSPADVMVIEPEPGKSAAAVFNNPAITEGRVRVKLTAEGDEMALDNEAWLMLAKPRPVNLLVVGPGNYFLKIALKEEPFCNPTYMEGLEYENAADTGALAASAYDMVIFDRYVPDELPPGAYLFIGAVPPVPGFASEGTVERPAVMDWDISHPVNQYVSYAGVLVARAFKLTAPPDAKTLLEADSGPLIVWHDSPTHRIVAIGFDLFDSHWPLRPSFPIFMANAIRYLGSGSLGDSSASIRPGRTILYPAVPGSDKVTVTYPDGRKTELLAQSGYASFADTFQIGHYLFESGGQARSFVVNLCDAAEANLAPAGELKWQAEAVKGTARAEKENREVWQYFALAAFGILMLEWYIYNRRVYV